MGQAANREIYLPRGAVPAIGAVLGLAFLGALAGSLQGHRAGPQSTVLDSRSLRFKDMPDGTVGVFDAVNGLTVDRLPRQSNNFLRALVRGLVNGRHQDNPNPDQAFLLTAWADGRLTLVDSADGRTIELEAFGPTNEAAFMRLLRAKEVEK
jgi:putative photosynthetic complex assembly protein